MTYMYNGGLDGRTQIGCKLQNSDIIILSDYSKFFYQLILKIEFRLKKGTLYILTGR